MPEMHVHVRGRCADGRAQHELSRLVLVVEAKDSLEALRSVATQKTLAERLRAISREMGWMSARCKDRGVREKAYADRLSTPCAPNKNIR